MKIGMQKKAAILLSIALILDPGMAVHAAGNTRDGIKSYGHVHFTNKTLDDASDDVIIESADLIWLADHIDVLRELVQ